MTTDAVGSGAITRAANDETATIALPEWANEKSPSLGEILSARDVERITRRHRWMIRTLTMFGRFPKQRTFHGRAIGWAKDEVLGWLNECAISQSRALAHRRFECSTNTEPPVSTHSPHRRRLAPCSKRRKGGGP